MGLMKSVLVPKMVFWSGMAKGPNGESYPKMRYFDSFHPSGVGDTQFRQQVGWLPVEANISESLYRSLISNPIPAVYNLDVRISKVNKDGTAVNQVYAAEYLEQAFIGDLEDVLPQIKPLLSKAQTDSVDRSSPETTNSRSASATSTNRRSAQTVAASSN
jgi:hypothetical protein